MLPASAKPYSTQFDAAGYGSIFFIENNYADYEQYWYFVTVYICLAAFYVTMLIFSYIADAIANSLK